MRAFACLGELGNYRAAAQMLGMTQPTLSKQISRLEDLLGRQLFHRSRQGTELTDFGRQLLLEVQPLAREADRVWDRGLRLAAGEIGQLALGFTFSAVGVMTQALIAYREAYPDVQISFNDISSQIQLPMLRESKLDIAFARWPGASDLASEIVSRDRLAFVYPVDRGDRITSFDSPAVKQIPFIRLKRTIAPGFEAAVERVFEMKSIQPPVTHWVNESLVQLRMVTAGLGVAIMHESALMGVIDERRLTTQSLYGPGLSWQTAMFWRRDERNSVVLNFLETARKTMQPSTV